MVVGSLGSVTGYRHSRNPGRTYDFLMVRGGPCLEPGVAYRTARTEVM
jgi:hypothetical protein